MRQSGNFAENATGFKNMVVLALLLLAAGLLSACNSGSLSDGLESAARPQPSQGLTNQTATAPSGGQSDLNPTVSDGTDTTAPQDQTQVAGLPSSKAVAFLPVSNAPQSAVTNLARSIRSSAQSYRVPVVASFQQGAKYQVKGYFSALEDGSGTLLVYVWDVLDRNNKRVYRINGQEQSNAKSSDPWGAVTPQMLNRVADNTMAQLKSWLASR